jgi:hypothetical protein
VDSLWRLWSCRQGLHVIARALVHPPTFTIDLLMPAGRPSSYDPKFVPIATKLCELGATDADLANAFECAVSTIALWKVKHKEFSDATKLPKAAADDRVEQSLYKRAMGYEADETDIRVVNGVIVTTQVRKIYPPDTAAAIFWLKNRRKGEWRDRVESEVHHTFENIPDSELEARIAALQNESSAAN